VSSQRPVIAIPLSHRFRRFRYRVVPVLVFLAAGTGAVWLWQQQAGTPRAVGEVEVVRYELAAPAGGILVSPSGPAHQLFDLLAAGELVARLDDRPVLASLEMVRGEVVRLQKELEATAAKTALDLAAAASNLSTYNLRKLTESRQLALDLERARLTLVDRKALLEADRVQLQRLNELYEATRKVFLQGAETQYMMLDVQLRRDTVAARCQGEQKAVEEAQQQLQTVQSRQEGTLKEIAQLPALPPAQATLAALLAPLQAAVAVEEAHIRQVQLQVDSLVIRSPAAGRICDIYRRPGQAVQPGDPILAVTVPRSRNVISYVREYQSMRPEVGMEADIRVRTLPRRTVSGRVEQVGPPGGPAASAPPSRPAWPAGRCG